MCPSQGVLQVHSGMLQHDMSSSLWLSVVTNNRATDHSDLPPLDTSEQRRGAEQRNIGTVPIWLWLCLY